MLQTVILSQSPWLAFVMSHVNGNDFLWKKKKIKIFSIGIDWEHVCSIRSTTNKHDWNLIFGHFASLNLLAFQWMALVRLNTVTVTYYCSAFQLRLQKCNRLKFRALALVNNNGISVIEFRFIDALKNFKMAKCIIWSFVWHHLLICIGVYRRIWISLFFLCIRKSISGIFLLENKNDIQVSQLVSHKSRYSISNKASTAFNFNILGIPFSLNSWRKV